MSSPTSSRFFLTLNVSVGGRQVEAEEGWGRTVIKLLVLPGPGQHFYLKVELISDIDMKLEWTHLSGSG